METTRFLVCLVICVVVLYFMILHLIDMRIERVKRELRALDKRVEACVKSTCVHPTDGQLKAGSEALAALIVRHPYATALVVVGCMAALVLAESRRG